MPGFSATLSLYDRMSAPIVRIATQADHLTKIFKAVNAASQYLGDAPGADVIRGQMDAAARATENLKERIAQIQSATRYNESAQGRHNAALSRGVGGANDLMKKITGIAAAYMTAQSIGRVIDLSDTMANNNARLSMIVDDGGSVAQLKRSIFDMAQRSRADFLSVTDIVAKLGTQAKNAFPRNGELLQFAENLNKTFTVAGANGQAAESVMYNLTQAMASGVLRGQDLNAVLSNTPQIAGYIADYMGVAVGQIRAMAAEGEISADVVKNAMLSATGDINAAFDKMPQTFGSVMTRIKNTAIDAFDGMLQRLNDVANSPGAQTMVTGIENALYSLGNAAVNAFDALAGGVQWVSENWSTLGPIITGVAVALGVYQAACMAASAAQFIMAMTNPFLLIPVAIAAAIGAVYMLVGAFNDMTGASVSATGIIIGSLFVLGAAAANVGISIWNGFIMVVEGIVDAWNFGIYMCKSIVLNWVAGVIDSAANITACFDDVATGIANAFVDGINGAIRAVNWLIDALNKLLGFEIGKIGEFSHIDSITTTLRGASDAVRGAIGEFPQHWDSGLKANAFNLGDAFNTGYGVGAGIENAIGDFFKSPAGPPLPPVTTETTPVPFSGDTGSGNDKDAKGKAENAPKEKVDKIKNDTGQIAKNTDKTNASLDEQLKYLRDIAERQTLDRFAAATINVTLGGVTQNVNSNMDLDGVIDYVVDGLRGGIAAAAAGVHL